MAEKSKVCERILEIDGCFGVSGQTLAVKGRVLIAEGVLTKSCRSGVKARQFFLFNDILVYGSILVQNIKYRAQHVIPLEEVSVRLLEEGEGETEHGWVVNTREKSFTVYAATRGEKTEWINAINKVSEDNISDLSSQPLSQATTKLLAERGKPPCRDFAPVLQPSKSSPACSSCHLEWSVLVRRHHCHRCGRLVCTSCSSNRVRLPSRFNKPLRVCLACFTVLSEIKGRGGQNGTSSLPSPGSPEKIQTNQEETPALTLKQEEEISQEVDEAGEAARAKLVSPGNVKSLYQLADTGLWWDSFEEEPQFELEEDFESQLALSEGEDWNAAGGEAEGGGGGGGSSSLA